MRSAVSLLERLMGVSDANPSPPPAPDRDAWDDSSLPFMSVPGLPREVVVVSDSADGERDHLEAVRTGAVTLRRALENLARVCASVDHAALGPGLRCRTCAGAQALARFVRHHGRVRALPG